MAAVKLIKFVAVAILVSSSDAEPTNQTCAGQDLDETVALQVGVQSHLGKCLCGEVCPGYYKQSHYSCSAAKKAYLASNPGVHPEAFLQTECSWKTPDKIGNTKCWSHRGSALEVAFVLGDVPAGNLAQPDTDEQSAMKIAHIVVSAIRLI
eukprot:CAMPEP_0115117012 /NCGR_PEP_ID=MMETSP0227-20121206/43627_1 /TAXON_ID=89957 /ORGANISM="Polarella glacialis, Strain CCMP 1383" /LENGTH=150 /DNA_ID=CAMNT_0002517979 /DNA_START=98 /DNA_END=551 /DNA_ORIENTATION=-